MKCKSLVKKIFSNYGKNQHTFSIQNLFQIYGQNCALFIYKKLEIITFYNPFYFLIFEKRKPKSIISTISPSL